MSHISDAINLIIESNGTFTNSANNIFVSCQNFEQTIDIFVDKKLESIKLIDISDIQTAGDLCVIFSNIKDKDLVFLKNCIFYNDQIKEIFLEILKTRSFTITTNKNNEMRSVNIKISNFDVIIFSKPNIKILNEVVLSCNSKFIIGDHQINTYSFDEINENIEDDEIDIDDEIIDMNSELKIYLAKVECISTNNYDLDEIQEEDDNKIVCDYLSTLIASFVNSVQTRLNSGDKCYFIYREDNDFFKIPLISSYGTEKSCKDDIYKKLYDVDLNSIIESGAFLVSFHTHNIDHWDYNFIKLSEHFGGGVSIFGQHPDFDDVTYQRYDNGDYDTGIMVDNEENDYLGSNMLKAFELKRSLFNKIFYT